jgi:isopenicillin N synthase-like dioxygenase
MQVVRAASREEVPVLDLGSLTGGGDLTALAHQLDHACRTIGFFYIANHGMPAEVIDNVFAATKRYFDLPLEERLRHTMDDKFRRGFMRQGINQHPGFAADLKESYEIGVDLPETHPSVAAGLPLHGPNRWPAEHPWLRSASDAYFKQTTELGLRLLQLFAIGLNLPQDFFLQFCKNPMVQMRLFHYPPQPPVSPDNMFGVAPHTDYGMITLLAQDPIGGLELRKLDGEWVAAPYIEGTLVVNLGDLFQRWTNDVYVSNPHRVVNRTGRERYSIPTFFNLDYDALVECLPTCCSTERPAKYEPIRSGDYLLGRFRDVQKYKTPQTAA